MYETLLPDYEKIYVTVFKVLPSEYRNSHVGKWNPLVDLTILILILGRSLKSTPAAPFFPDSRHPESSVSTASVITTLPPPYNSLHRDVTRYFRRPGWDGVIDRYGVHLFFHKEKQNPNKTQTKKRGTCKSIRV